MYRDSFLEVEEPPTERIADVGVPVPKRPWTWLSPKNIGAVYVLIAIIVVFSVWAPDTFPTVDTVKVILNQNAVTGIIALSLVVPLSAGVFDLSIGYVMGLASVVCAYLLVNTALPVPIVVASALIVSLFAGAINAALVVRLGIDSFIGTLGSGAIALAAIILISNQQAITGDRLGEGFADIAISSVGGITAPVILMLVVAAVLWWLMDHTATGRRIYATGFNAEAARLTGVRTGRLRAASLLSSSVLAGLAGVVICAQVSAGSPDIGPPYLLNAFATAFLGATQLRSGRFNAWGTVLAVLVLGTGQTGLSLVGAPVWGNSMFTGLVLLGALAVTKLQRRNNHPTRTA